MREALALADSALAATALTAKVEHDRPIGTLTTYRVGGHAARFVTVDSVDELVSLSGVVAASGLPSLVIGRGSNLLVADAGFDGIAVQLGGGFSAVDIEGTTV